MLGGHLAGAAPVPGRAPDCAVWDQEGAIGQWHGRKMVFSEAFQAFRGMLGMGARSVLAATDPETKGIVERNNGYLGDEFPARPALRRRRPTSTRS